MFSEDKGFLHAPVVSFGAPFESEVVSVSVRTHADCVRSVEEQVSADCMGHHGHNEQLRLSCHGDGGGSALVQHCLFHHYSYCLQQASHFFAVVDDGAVDVVVSLVTFQAGCPALRWTLQNLHFLLLQWMWHCEYV